MNPNLQYLVTPQSVSDGGSVGPQADVVGNLKITVNTNISGERSSGVPNGSDYLATREEWLYRNFVTNGTTNAVKSGSGFVSHITVNNPSALTVANHTIVVYDGLTAVTPIATFVIPFGLTTAVPFDLPIGCTVNTGITIASTGSTANADITLYYA